LTHKRIKTNGVNVHYVTVGQGPVVLCIHGWPQSHRKYLPLFEQMSDSYTLIAPDMRGFGDSDKPMTATSRRTSPAIC